MMAIAFVALAITLLDPLSLAAAPLPLQLSVGVLSLLVSIPPNSTSKTYLNIRNTGQMITTYSQVIQTHTYGMSARFAYYMHVVDAQVCHAV
jgi:hypothetical protein